MESHPAVYIPKHSYKKYKMQPFPNYRQTGLTTQIRSKQLAPDQFAICNLIKNHSYAKPKL